MALHLAAFNSLLLQSAASQQVNAIGDQALPPQNNNIVVPGQLPGGQGPLNQLACVFGLGANITAAQLQSPSLRRLFFPDIAPLNVAATPSTPLPVYDLWDDMVALDSNEQLSAFATQNAAGTQQVSVIVMLSDGIITPAGGELLTVKCSGTTTLVANAWTNVPLTFSQVLPVGQYQVVGMRAASAGGIAARIIFPGFVYRPGVICADAISGIEWRRQRYGGMGVLGVFSSNVLPSVEFLSGSADTAETVFFDLVRVSSTP